MEATPNPFAYARCFTASVVCWTTARPVTSTVKAAGMTLRSTRHARTRLQQRFIPKSALNSPMEPALAGALCLSGRAPMATARRGARAPIVTVSVASLTSSRTGRSYCERLRRSRSITLIRRCVPSTSLLPVAWQAIPDCALIVLLPLQKNDSYHGFRSDYIHFSMSITSPTNRHCPTDESDPAGYNSFHFSPKGFTHFFAWWRCVPAFLLHC